MYNDNQGGGSGSDRQMVSGNWSCSKCGDAITELPFEPSGDRPIFCRNCYKSNRPSGGGGGSRGDRQMVEGDWKCSQCGTEIKQLPFKPNEGQDVSCRECYMKSRN